MKYIMLAVFGASICCVIVPINGQATRENPSAREAKTGKAQPPKIDTVNVDSVNVTKLTVQQHAETNGKSDDDKKKSDSYFHRLTTPENLPNLILSAVGVLGIGIAICTLIAIKRQTKVFHGQLIAMQRPKIAVKRVSVIPSENDHWRIACVIANIGGSKAEIIDSDLTILKLGVGTVQGLLPSLPPYAKRYSFGHFCLEAGERQEKSVILDKKSDGTVMTDTKLLLVWHSMTFGQVNMERSPIICFGYFHYRDASGIARRTGFGAEWNAADMGFTWLDSPDYQYTD